MSESHHHWSYLLEGKKMWKGFKDLVLCGDLNQLPWLSDFMGVAGVAQIELAKLLLQ